MTERQLILASLRANQGKPAVVARELGLSIRALRYRMQKLGLMKCLKL